MAETLSFYVIAAFSLFAAYFVVSARNIFHCAVGLIAVLIGIAGMYLLMEAQFLSAIQVTVYLGGIVVLTVFAILMVADVTQKVFRLSRVWRKQLVGSFAAGLFLLIVSTIFAFDFGETVPPHSTTVHELGQALLDPGREGYVLPFETVSLLLLAALISAVTIARPDEPEQEGEEEPRP